VKPSGLLLGADGSLTGTTFLGGAGDGGTVFRFTPPSTMEELYAFPDTGDSGTSPLADLVRDAAGNLYGTTYAGADDHGTVFRLAPDQTLTVLHAFTGPDGASPRARLLLLDGWLYGTAACDKFGDDTVCVHEGVPFWGSVYAVATDGTGFITLHRFAGGTGGAYPQAGLVQGSDGALYGTTRGDCPNVDDCTYGTIFKIDPDGTDFTTVHPFTGGPDGAYPWAALLLGPDGTLYGTTAGACPLDQPACTDHHGTVFALPLPPLGPIATLRTFTGAQAHPQAGLTQAADGRLFGTTAGCGLAEPADPPCTDVHGSLFALAPDGTAFHAQPFSGPNGATPEAGVILGDNYLYGTTTFGGLPDGGVIFRAKLKDSLTVEVTGSGTVAGVPAGIDCPDTCQADHYIGTQVTLTAAPAAHYTVTWGGACSGTGLTCTVTITEATAVTATFTLQTYTLTVTPPTNGTGTITTVPAGVDCGADCTQDYTYNTGVTLTATPAAGYALTSWGGACTGAEPTCTVAMTEARTVTATFVPGFDLTVILGGSGAGTVTSAPAGISCGSTCVRTFAPSPSVTLTATPAAGATFREWRGACTGTGACTVSVTAATSVTAVFSKTFTDATLGVRTTQIKALHFTELREAINTLRSRRTPVLPAFNWTDAAPATGGVVRASHLTDLRAALNGIQVQSYAEPTITGGSTAIKAGHLMELREKVSALEVQN
jgi:uncharacterized repeat protein (TIGR03803 family)